MWKKSSEGSLVSNNRSTPEAILVVSCADHKRSHITWEATSDAALSKPDPVTGRFVEQNP